MIARGRRTLTEVIGGLLALSLVVGLSSLLGRAEEDARVLVLVPERWVMARQFFPILDVLAEHGIHVDVASDAPHEHVFWEDYVDVATGGDPEAEYSLSVELAYDDVDVLTYDAVLVPGGHSHHAIIANDDAREILLSAARLGKLVGGVGQGVSVLVEFGLIAGHRATIGPGEAEDPRTPNDQRIIEEAGGTYAWACVVVSAESERGFTLVTATASCVYSFARAIAVQVGGPKD